MMKRMRGVHTVTFILLVIGGINWLLAAFSWDIATWGISMSVLKVVYILIGLSAVYEATTHAWRCRECKPDMMNSNMNKM